MITVNARRISDSVAAELAAAFAAEPALVRKAAMISLRADAKHYRGKAPTPDLHHTTLEAIAGSFEAVAAEIERIDALQVAS